MRHHKTGWTFCALIGNQIGRSTAGKFHDVPPKCVVSLPASRGRFESFASGNPFLARRVDSLRYQTSDASG
jgi:hypothetical protein